MRRPWMWISLGAGALALSAWTLTARAIEPGTGAATPSPAGAEGSEAKLGSPTSASVGNHGGTIVADAHGFLVVDRGSHSLIRTDREGKALAALTLEGAPGEIVHDGASKLFLADRHGDRIVRVAPGDASGAGLAEQGSVELREPHGLALTPDGETLLATSVAEHELVALDAETLELRWRLELMPEPRGVAVASSGEVAAVGFLTTGSVAFVDLVRGELMTWQALDPRDHVRLVEKDDGWGDTFTVARIEEARSRFAVPVETGRRYSRGAFALAYLSDDVLVAANQLATPQLRRVPARDRNDTYGGGDQSIRPMVHRLSMMAGDGALGARPNHLEIPVHQPHAMAYDAKEDVLYVAGYGDERILAVRAPSSGLLDLAWVAELDGNGMKRAKADKTCGADGLVLDGEGGLWVHCEFRRNLVRVDVKDGSFEAGPELAEAKRSELVERGADLFRRSNPLTSDAGTLACSNCHPEARADGLTWRLGKSTLQAPVLAGRVTQTEPFKWDGQDPDLDASLHHTMFRLGGTPDEVKQADFDALVAYLESLPAPKPKSAKDPEAVARGRKVFEAEACNACHAGDRFVDHSQHDLETTMDVVDTPSLLGLSHSSPYYHDGSAKDLHTLVTDRGTIHEMADFSGLSPAERDDLVAYLEVL